MTRLITRLDVSRGRGLKLDVISVLCFVVAFFTGVFFVTMLPVDVRMAGVGLSIISFMIGGMVMGSLFQPPRQVLDATLDRQELFAVLNYGLFGLVLMCVAGIFVNVIKGMTGVAAMASLKLSSRLMLFSIGVSEEYAFRYGFLQWLMRSGLGAFLSILCSASVFASMHWVVYGSGLVYQADVTALVLMFIGGAVLAAVTIMTNRISPAIIAHGIYNSVFAFPG